MTAKEWMTKAPVRPALAVFPNFEAISPFPEPVALSSRAPVATKNVVYGIKQVNQARYRDQTGTHDQLIADKLSFHSCVKDSLAWCLSPPSKLSRSA